MARPGLASFVTIFFARTLVSFAHTHTLGFLLARALLRVPRACRAMHNTTHELCTHRRVVHLHGPTASHVVCR